MPAPVKLINIGGRQYDLFIFSRMLEKHVYMLSDEIVPQSAKMTSIMEKVISCCGYFFPDKTGKTGCDEDKTSFK